MTGIQPAPVAPGLLLDWLGGRS